MMRYTFCLFCFVSARHTAMFRTYCWLHTQELVPAVLRGSYGMLDLEPGPGTRQAPCLLYCSSGSHDGRGFHTDDEMRRNSIPPTSWRPDATVGAKELLCPRGHPSAPSSPLLCSSPLPSMAAFSCPHCLSVWWFCCCAQEAETAEEEHSAPRSLPAGKQRRRQLQA